MRSTKA
ncbi:Hypothetical protein SCV20265 4405 [Pseudomonas aeruginosa]|nr:Hypothetical protein SCV20265 4405 [Pseudomonas aeruginosa]